MALERKQQHGTHVTAQGLPGELLERVLAHVPLFEERCGGGAHDPDMLAFGSRRISSYYELGSYVFAVQGQGCSRLQCMEPAPVTARPAAVAGKMDQPRIVGVPHLPPPDELYKQCSGRPDCGALVVQAASITDQSGWMNGDFGENNDREGVTERKLQLFLLQSSAGCSAGCSAMAAGCCSCSAAHPSAQR